MKNILALILFMTTGARAQTYLAKNDAAEDQTKSIQAAFNNASIKTVLIDASDVIINGTVNIPDGKIIEIKNGFKIKGNGTINGGHINADYQHQIFDTSVTVNPRTVNQYFSVKWFGAKGNNTDDYAAIQKSINTCLKNNIRTLYIPAGRYKISKPLIIRNKEGSFCTLEILGESSFWDSNLGSEIIPVFTDGFAFGIQNGKFPVVSSRRLLATVNNFIVLHLKVSPMGNAVTAAIPLMQEL